MSVITIARGDATREQVAGALRQALGTRPPAGGGDGADVAPRSTAQPGCRVGPGGRTGRRRRPGLWAVSTIFDREPS